MPVGWAGEGQSLASGNLKLVLFYRCHSASCLITSLIGNSWWKWLNNNNHDNNKLRISTRLELWTHSVAAAPCVCPPPTASTPPLPHSKSFCRLAERKWAPSRGVAPPLGPDVSDCPVIHRSRRGERPLPPPGGRPPNRTVKYAHRKEVEGRKSHLGGLCASSCSPHADSGRRETPGKRLQLTVVLITIGRNKSQAGKSLDGNCYNCPDDGNEYFYPLNYKWLNI